MQYTENILFVKMKNFTEKNLIFFLIFAQNIDCGEAVLTSTHNLCFGAKIRKIGIPRIPQFCYIKVGFKGGYISRTCFRDAYFRFSCQFFTCNCNRYILDPWFYYV